MENLILLLVLGIIAGVGGLIKSSRERKEREERLRRLNERGPQPRRQPDGQRPQPTTRPASPLAEVRRFFEEVQAKGRRNRGLDPKQPAPGPQRAKEPEDRRKPLPSQARATVAKPEPVRRPTPASPVRRARRVRKPVEPVVVEAPRVVQVERPVTLAPKAQVAPTSRTKRATAPKLARILASSRPDLAKAVLLSEILTQPVALRRNSRIPRHRS